MYWLVTVAATPGLTYPQAMVLIESTTAVAKCRTKRRPFVPQQLDEKSESPMAVMWKPIVDWDDEGWRDQAACRHSDPDLFFPAQSTGLAVDHIHAAKAVCRSCPVQQPCLQFALETNQEAGVWGGKDEEERRKLRRMWRESAGRR